MNTHQNYDPASGQPTTHEPTARQCDQRPLPRNNGNKGHYETTFTMEVSIYGSRYEESQAKILFWAITDYQDRKLKDLLQIVNDPEGLEYEAGAIYNEIGQCTALLTELTMGLHGIGNRNRELLQLAHEPGRAAHPAQVDAYHRERLAEVINQTLKQ